MEEYKRGFGRTEFAKELLMPRSTKQSQALIFAKNLRETLLTKDEPLYEHLDILLKPICEYTGSFSAIIRLVDKMPEHQRRRRKMHLIAKHSLGGRETLEKFGERPIGKFIAHVDQQTIRHQIYEASQVQEILEFQDDLKSVRSQLPSMRNHPEMRAYCIALIEYLETIGSTIACRLRLGSDSNFIGFVFISKPIGECFTDKHKEFINDYIPVIETVIDIIKMKEQEEARQVIHKALDSGPISNRKLLYQKICEACRELTRCDIAVIREYNKAQGQFVLDHQAVFCDEYPTIPKFSPHSLGASAVAIETGQASLVADTRLNKRYIREIKEAEGRIAHSNSPEDLINLTYLKWIKSTIAVPLKPLMRETQNRSLLS